MDTVLGVYIVNVNFVLKILKYFIHCVTKMIVKIINVVKKIVILLHLDGILVVYIYGRFIKLMLICLAVKYVYLHIRIFQVFKQYLTSQIVPK